MTLNEERIQVAITEDQAKILIRLLQEEAEKEAQRDTASSRELSEKIKVVQSTIQQHYTIFLERQKRINEA